MSRRPIHRQRRIWCIWIPAVAIGSAIYIHSLGLTLTANGLTVFGLGIMLAGAMATIRESRSL